MHLATLTIENFRCFGEGDSKFELKLTPGLTALIGENESGKTAVVDALRAVLGTTDQERSWLDELDFYQADDSLEIRIRCQFESLTEVDRRTFLEFLTYDAQAGSGPRLFVTLTARTVGRTRGHPNRVVEIRSGNDGGPAPWGQGWASPQKSMELRPSCPLPPCGFSQQFV